MERDAERGHPEEPEDRDGHTRSAHRAQRPPPIEHREERDRHERHGDQVRCHAKRDIDTAGGPRRVLDRRHHRQREADEDQHDREREPAPPEARVVDG